MVETEYFNGRSVDEHDPVVTLRWLFIPSLLIVASLFLYGCAVQKPLPKATAQVCELKYLGKATDGNPVFLQACESIEQFKADQSAPSEGTSL